MSSVFAVNKNTYDVFVGKGYDNHIRISWNDKKWSVIAGNSNLFRSALTLFNEEKLGRK